MRKKISLLCSMLVTIGLLVACSDNSASTEQKSGKKSLTFVSNFPSDTLDPQLNYTTVRAGIAETLVKVNEQLQIEPWLAKKWKTEDNGTTWIFEIRDGITFQNGKDLNAEAVKHSLERTIKESEAMKSALKIKEMKASGQILTITTTEPLATLPSELVHPNTAIIDVDAPDIKNKPVGTGPFKVASFKPDNEMKVKKYNEYWGGEPKLDEVVLTFNDDENARTSALQSGEADIVYRPAIESLNTLKKDSSIVVDIQPSLRNQMLFYNSRQEAFKDKNVRKAFDVLLNPKDVVDTALAGQGSPAKGPFLKSLDFSNDQKTKTYGPSEAQTYLEKAGYILKDGKAIKNGKQLSFKLVTYSYRPELPLMSQMLQSEAKKIGVKIDIQQVENMDEYMTTKDDWGIVTYSLVTAPRGDAGYFFNALYTEGGAFNVGHFHEPALASIIDELNKTVDQKQRNKLARQAGEIAEKETLHSSIVHPNNFVAYKDNVKNWVTTKSEYYVITKDLDVK
ncbi:ABC transporter substrate-binding protein [Priestia aryabhattai]|uniref:ABC transporter substrate-binding protein n=1 Tax=Priestia aryabhattai TaxID=412384 RepID=A0AAX6N5P9_PRIAR|nr:MULTISPECIES: nickel ABC transporter substrate-binding protein [Priestia]MDU9691231.1 ABC transporter substrate-binding protein [Priestia aryabhattai]TPF17496.1 ABC transporter substrate-binding protein [Priestia megaterium]TPF23530.1 ABC transporter substrate-binding protein [Priestia megaterium]